MMRATVEELLNFLRIVKRYDNVRQNWKVIKKESMRSLGIIDREKLYHVIQSAKNLHLIEKTSKIRISLLAEGELLLHNQKKINDVLANLLLHYDYEYEILRTMISFYNDKSRPDYYPGSFIPFEELYQCLKHKYSRSSLQHFLDNFYVRSGLILKGAHNSYALNVSRYELLSETKIFSSAAEISNEKFFDALYKAYQKLRTEFSPYVPIPELREETCKLCDPKLPSDEFDKKLSKFPLEFKGKIIDFAPPRGKKPGGIRRKEKYIYYLAIFEKCREHD